MKKVWWLWQEEKEKKLIWRFAYPGNWTPVSSVKGESTDHYTKEDLYKLIEIFYYINQVAVFFQFSPLKVSSGIRMGHMD